MRLNINNNKKTTKTGAIIFSVIVALLLVVADYGMQNSTFPLFDSVPILSWADLPMPERMDAKKNFFNEEDVSYVNFGKDKALVPVLDEFNDTIGKEVITDRKTLLEFLELAKRSTYKYIFLDVRFEKGYETPYDSALFCLIKTMPNLIIATHRGDGDYEMTDSTLIDKAAFADYRGTLFSGFTRYEFLQNGSRSVALQMYHDLDKKDITKCWFGFKTINGRLCYNLKFIPLPNFLCKGKSIEMGETTSRKEMRYPYAGSEILNTDYHSEEEVIEKLLNGKIVVAGDFDNDLHGTYIGEIPGPILSLAAYKFLHAGLHKVRLLFVLFLFVLYFLISYIIITKGHLANYLKNRPVLFVFVSLFSLSFIFLLLKLILYRFFLISMVVFVPTVVFWVISAISFAKSERIKIKQDKLVA